MSEQDLVYDSDSAGTCIFLEPKTLSKKIADHVQILMMPNLLQLQKSVSSFLCRKTEINDDGIKTDGNRVRSSYVDFAASVNELNALIQICEEAEKQKELREKIADHIQISMMSNLLKLWEFVSSFPCGETEINDDGIKADDNRMRSGYVDFAASVHELNNWIRLYEEAKKKGEIKLPFRI